MNQSNFNFIERDYSFSLGQYLDRGWQIFRQYLGGFVGFFFLNIGISFLISFAPESQAVIIAIFSNLVSIILTAGYYIVAIKIAKGKRWEFIDFFEGFRKFMPIILVNLLAFILIFIGYILLIIPGIYLSISYYFTLLFVIEYRFSFWQALEASRKVVDKKWWAFFGLYNVLFLINLGGLLALGIGLSFTLPFTYCIAVAAFEDIVGFKTIGRL